MKICHTEGEAHPRHGHSNGEPGIPLDDSSIDFESDKEEEETETNVRHKGEEWARVVREDVLGESRYTTECGGTFKHRLRWLVVTT